jgi:cytochrome oxidase assembly protein ShyY1
MDKLGRSLGLMGLGLLFLLGGWQLERLRRRLNAHITEGGVQ